MQDLTTSKCKPCEGGVAPMTRSEIETYRDHIPQWSVREDKYIDREFQFKDFVEALAFVNKVGDIAEAEGHHPDILIFSWNKVKITLWTHAIGGLSINDFIVAVKIDRIT